MSNSTDSRVLKNAVNIMKLLYIMVHLHKKSKTKKLTEQKSFIKKDHVAPKIRKQLYWPMIFNFFW